MARIKAGKTTHARRKRVLKLAKGYFGSHSKQFRTANQAVMRALRYATIGRRLRKRDFRRLWITRINAATRSNGISYSRFIDGLKKAGVTVNRKILADLAIHDAVAFTQLVDVAKGAR